MTLDEAIQAVVAARTQYHTVHQQVQHLREAWAASYAPLLQDEAVQKQAVRQAEEITPDAAAGNTAGRRPPRTAADGPSRR